MGTIYSETFFLIIGEKEEKNLMQNVSIYTCVTGGYDAKVPRLYRSTSIDSAVVYSDDLGIKANGWSVSVLQSPAKIHELSLINRWHKLFPQKLLTDTYISIYIDGNIQITKDLFPLITQFQQSGAAFGCLKHPQRGSVSEEAEACLRLNKFTDTDKRNINFQLAGYYRDGFPKNHPLFAAGVLFRKHSSDKLLDEAMSLWWDEIRRKTSRDQISLPYVLWKTGLKYHVFDIDIFSNNYFLRHPHNAEPYFFGRLQQLKNKIRSKIMYFI